MPREMRRLLLRRLTIKAALVLGFSLTLGVWLFTGYHFTRRMSEVEAQTAAISARYLRAQERLSTLSAQVLLSSVYLRDALLEPDDASLVQQRRRLEQIYDDLDAQLDAYVPVLDSARERKQVDRLRAEIASFRSTTRDVLGHAAARTPAEVRAVINSRVVPRRESVIRVTEDVRAFNRTAFLEQQRAIADLHEMADRRSWQWLGGALAVSLGIGVIATAYASRLEGRLQQQHALESQNAQYLQLLSARLITAQEEERQNIARELHDEVGQALTAIKVELAVAQRQLALTGGTPGLLEELEAIADNALKTVRDLSHLLHPSLLDDLGLPAAVDWYLQAFSRRSGIAVEMQQDGMTRRLASAVELAAYRVVQEALTNVARHAQATRCRVTLRLDDNRVSVTIEDDGVGFDPAAVCAMGERRGLGLLGMRERAAQLKGELSVRSARGEGTRVQLDLPALPASVPDSDSRPEASRG